MRRRRQIDLYGCLSGDDDDDDDVLMCMWEIMCMRQQYTKILLYKKRELMYMLMYICMFVCLATFEQSKCVKKGQRIFFSLIDRKKMFFFFFFFFIVLELNFFHETSNFFKCKITFNHSRMRLEERNWISQ
jgi:hypothetical protein